MKPEDPDYSGPLTPGSSQLISPEIRVGPRRRVQLPVRLQQAILRPSAPYSCEVWAPSAAAITPLRELQNLQQYS